MKPIRSPFYLLLACTAVLYSQYNPICGLPYIAGQTWNGPVQLKKSMQDNPVNREFKIRKDILNITYDPIEIDCRLLYEDSSFLIYGEAAQIDSGNIDTVAVNSLVTWFRDSTAAGSIAPDQGIKAIADSIFGPPPDIDGNGQVFILLIDVRDNFDPDTSQNFVAGYFDPADQGYGGNYADIIYLDTDPGRITGSHTSLLMSTLAHEYQHLIHYGRDPREDDWLNEGLSELSPVLMGLPHRNFTHYLADTNVRLDKFDNELADYARCGLFFLYTWWEFGTPLIQDIVRDTEDGILSVDKQLSAQGGPTIDEFVLEWHLANMLPSDYSYTRQYTIPQPALHTVINSYPHEASIDVARLGAHWSVINAGASLYMKSTDAGPNDDVQLLLIREPDHSFIDAPQLDVVGYLDTTFGIDYSGLLILATTGSSVATTAQYGLFASATGGYREELLSFDEDREVDKFILLGDEEFTGAAAIRFDIPDESAELSSIQFYTAGSDSVEVKIATGLPPTEITTLYNSIVPAPLTNTWTTHRVPASLMVSDQSVYVVVESRDGALAYFDAGPSSISHYRQPQTDFFSPLSWFSVDTQKLEGNWAVRLSYLVPSAGQDPHEIPPGIGPFYPNPFIASREGKVVRLNVLSFGNAVDMTIYNLLGQQVYRHPGRTADDTAPLVWDGFLNNGRMAPSGIYFAVIESRRHRDIRKMILIR